MIRGGGRGDDSGTVGVHQRNTLSQVVAVQSKPEKDHCDECPSPAPTPYQLRKQSVRVDREDTQLVRVATTLSLPNIKSWLRCSRHHMHQRRFVASGRCDGAAVNLAAAVVDETKPAVARG